MCVSSIYYITIYLAIINVLLPCRQYLLSCIIAVCHDYKVNYYNIITVIILLYRMRLKSEWCILPVTQKVTHSDQLHHVLQLAEGCIMVPVILLLCSTCNNYVVVISETPVWCLLLSCSHVENQQEQKQKTYPLN